MKPNICVNPWLGIHLNGNQGYNPCCVFKDTYQVSLDEYTNHSITDVKTAFLDGNPPSACNFCFEEETRGILSKRQRDNKKYGHLLKRKLDSHIQDQFVEYYIRLGNHCNLRCMTCNSYLSSGWVSENKKYGDSSQSAWTIDSDHEIWNHIKQNSKHTGLINFIGGEPFMMLETEQENLLDSLIESDDSKHIVLQYNTNCTKRYLPISERWSKFRKVEIKVSMDGVGKRFEYLRYPAKWDEFEKNLDWYINLSQQHPNIELTVIYTISVFNFGYAQEAAEFCKNKNIKIFWNTLENPQWFNSVNIPHAKSWIISQLSDTTDENLISYVHSLETQQGNDLTEKFKQVVAMIDNRRTMRFQDVFEELAFCIP